jgi:hypothetical protein
MGWRGTPVTGAPASRFLSSSAGCGHYSNKGPFSTPVDRAFIVPGWLLSRLASSHCQPGLQTLRANWKKRNLHPRKSSALLDAAHPGSKTRREARPREPRPLSSFYICMPLLLTGAPANQEAAGSQEQADDAYEEEREGHAAGGG